MTTVKVIGIFDITEDAQIAINELIEAGFDSQTVSLIMKDKTDEPEEETPVDIDNLANIEVTQGEKVYGTIEPIEGLDINQGPVHFSGIGDIILAGPITTIFDDENDSNVTPIKNELKKDDLFINLGIALEDIEAMAHRIKAGSIILSIDTEEENRDEIEGILSDNSGDIYP